MGSEVREKERPILFSGPMVRAILEGRKTQTRRLVKPQPDNPETFGISPVWGHGVHRDGIFKLHAAFNEGGKRVDKFLPCPYGAPGDRLWVRETIYRGPPQGAGDDSATYAADGAFTDLDTWPWKANYLPSIHMPRGLCRVVLEVTGVRVERLHAITDEDAAAEGIAEGGYGIGNMRALTAMGANRYHFATLWDQINGKRADWMSNPWVWVIGFKRLDTAASAALPPEDREPMTDITGCDV